ncbi:DUF547 domain-containing protein [Roseivirga sp.]|uniref:DUF547 domain-containing protein n=1 Tax=Roseivirga sp. TaxID=1964215 RepID=UPI003B5177B1
MRKYKLWIVAFLLTALSVSAQAQTDKFFKNADQFFKAHVNKGRVDYKTIHSSDESLNALLSQIDNFPLNSVDNNTRQAFMINAYNLLVIKGIINDYPTKSPLDIGGFFDQKKYSVAGEKITLNTLEKEWLFAKYKDERFHFVLVCAALSCPPIISEAYLPGTLEKQLEEQTRKALNDPSFIRVKSADKTVELSQIFEWYKSDFPKDVIQFINKYRQQAIPQSYKVGYYNYDWTLNAGSSGQNPRPTPSPGNSSNLQTYTPSVLLKKGQSEVKLFNSIYTQTESRDRQGESIPASIRQSYFNATFNFNWGVSKSSKVNLGFDLLFTTYAEGRSVLAPLGASSEFNESVLAAFGPAIRFVPFKNISQISVRSAFWFPGESSLENRDGRFVAHDRYTWFTQVFFDQKLSTQWRLFLEADLLYRFSKNSDRPDFFRLPLTSILSFFPGSKSSIYITYQYSPRYETVSNAFDSQFGLSQWFMLAGLGAKYQLTSSIELELAYSNFFASRNDGAGSTFNLGLRVIR